MLDQVTDPVLAELRELRQEVSALRKLCDQHFGQPDDDALTVPAAAAICRKSPQTLRKLGSIYGPFRSAFAPLFDQ